MSSLCYHSIIKKKKHFFHSLLIEAGMSQQGLHSEGNAANVHCVDFLSSVNRIDSWKTTSFAVNFYHILCLQRFINGFPPPKKKKNRSSTIFAFTNFPLSFVLRTHCYFPLYIISIQVTSHDGISFKHYNITEIKTKWPKEHTHQSVHGRSNTSVTAQKY